MKRAVKSLEELAELAGELLPTLAAGDTVLLSGPLGAGKTAFTQALARSLGITEKVNSPTFTIVAEYQVPNHESIKTLVHADLYRLDEKQAASDPAVQDVLQRASEPGRLTIIEWAERLPVKSLRDHGVQGRWIMFDYGSTENERMITVKDNGA